MADYTFELAPRSWVGGTPRHGVVWDDAETRSTSQVTAVHLQRRLHHANRPRASLSVTAEPPCNQVHHVPVGDITISVIVPALCGNLRRHDSLAPLGEILGKRATTGSPDRCV